MFRFMKLPRVSPSLLLVSGFSAYSMAQFHARPVFNDAVIANRTLVAPKSRFNGKLDYHQLTFGSFTGMASGYVIGRVSSFLVFWIVSTLMGAEYLALAGLIDVKPLNKAIYRWGRSALNQEILVDDPSFKVSFLLSFVIAAFYS